MPKQPFVIYEEDLLDTEPSESCAMCGKDIFTGPFCEECDVDTAFDVEDGELLEDWLDVELDA